MLSCSVYLNTKNGQRVYLFEHMCV